MEKEQRTKTRLPGKIEALVPIAVLLAIMISNYVFDWGQDPHIPVLIACKEHIVSQEGVDIQYRLFGSSLHSCWTWSEITTLHQDTRKAAPNVMLHFGKGVNTRVFVMKPEDSQTVLALAKRANPQIHIADMGG